MTVLVIGAGVIGAAVAQALASRGARVVVLDMRSPGSGASHASAGILAPYVEGQHKGPLLRLGTRSLELFNNFITRVRDACGLPIEYARTGTLEIALTREDHDRLVASKAWLDANGVKNELLEGRDLARFEPAVTATALNGLLIREHGFVGVPSLMNALVQSARLAGAWFESPVEAVHVEPDADRVNVRAGERRYTGDFVIVASGSWSGRVRVAGQPALPIRPVRGQSLRLRWTSGPPPARVVWGPRCYAVPWSDGSLVVGGTVEEVGFDERTTIAGVRDLTDAVGELLPHAWQASLEEVRVGLRPASVDELPVVGPFRDAPRVVAATGHYRNGILLAPLTAEVVARYVLDGERDPALSVTTPDRFIPPSA